jgi:hypothetical protein
MTLADTLWQAYRAFRCEHPCSLVTVTRIVWQLRRMWLRAPVEQVRALLRAGECPRLELRERDVVTEHPVYPATNVPAQAGERIMWGGKRNG